MKRLNIKQKLIILVGLLIFGVIGIGATGFVASKILGSSLDTVINDTVPVIRHLTLVDMVHDGVRGSVLEAMLGAATQDDAIIASAQQDIKDHKEKVTRYFELILSKNLSPAMKNQTNLAAKQIQEYIAAGEDTIKLAANKDLIGAKKEFAIFQNKFESLEQSLEKLGEFSENENTEKFELILSRIKKSQIFLIGVIFLILFISVILGFVIITTLTNTLQKITQNLNMSTDGVGTVATQLASASAELSSAATNQASSLQQTAASIEQISCMVKKSAESAQESQKVSLKSRETAQQGQKVAQELLSSINEINSSNDKIVSQISSSNQKSTEIINIIKEISTKTKVINDIVFQTKLLSFNASVEAARAGEQGKGFAVVAEEVGNLANMSGNASKEISHLLEQSMQRVEAMMSETNSKIGELMLTVKSTVSHGSDVAKQCGEVLSEIVDTSLKVTEMISDIAAATQEQAHGVAEISRAIHHLDQDTQKNARSANSCSHLAEQLSNQIQELRNSSAHLNVIVKGQENE